MPAAIAAAASKPRLIHKTICGRASGSKEKSPAWSGVVGFVDGSVAVWVFAVSSGTLSVVGTVGSEVASVADVGGSGVGSVAGCVGGAVLDVDGAVSGGCVGGAVGFVVGLVADGFIT